MLEIVALQGLQSWFRSCVCFICSYLTEAIFCLQFSFCIDIHLVLSVSVPGISAVFTCSYKVGKTYFQTNLLYVE